MLGITEETLRKYYRFELDEAKTKIDVRVEMQAMKAIAHGSVDMTKFYLERRGGWVPPRHVIAGAEDAPLKVETTVRADESAAAFLDEFARLKAASGKAPPVAGDGET